MSISMTSVKSSQIKAIGYDAPSMTLEVHFNSGARYRYHGVPADIHEGLLKAPSVGKYFGLHIKSNQDIKHSRIFDPEK